MFTYEQATGKLFDDRGMLVLTGYSGKGKGLNNPAMQDLRDVGPLPCGYFTIGDLQAEHPVLGKNVMPLIPDADNQMFGRSDFYLHGDNEAMDHTGSEGCIVAGADRLLVAHSADKRLCVIPGIVTPTANA